MMSNLLGHRSFLVVTAICLLCHCSQSDFSSSEKQGSTQGGNKKDLDKNRNDRPSEDIAATDGQTCIKDKTAAKAAVVFVLDVTASMAPAAELIENSILGMIDEFRSLNIDVEYGLVPFDDQSYDIGKGGFFTEVKSLNRYLQYYRSPIGQLRHHGGMGIEGGFDGISRAYKILRSRQKSAKYMIYISDAISHNGQYDPRSCSSDRILKMWKTGESDINFLYSVRDEPFTEELINEGFWPCEKEIRLDRVSDQIDDFAAQLKKWNNSLNIKSLGWPLAESTIIKDIPQQVTCR